MPPGRTHQQTRLVAPANLRLSACVLACVFTRAGSPWRVWSSARPRRDGDVRYQFVVYTREAPAAAAAGARGQQVDVVGAPPVLPPGVASKHDEHQVRARAPAVFVTFRPNTPTLLDAC